MEIRILLYICHICHHANGCSYCRTTSVGTSDGTVRAPWDIGDIQKHGTKRRNSLDERAIGDCVLAKICYYNAHCNGNSDKWNISDYIDVLLLWKSIGLHVLADDANALYPCTPIRPVLWPGDLVIGPLTLKIIRALYSATMYLCMKFCEAMSKHSWLKRDNLI